MNRFVKRANMADTKPIYIPDVSVILKWFLEESGDNSSEKALSLRYDFFRGSVSLEVPHYAFAEIMNIFGRTLPREQAMYNFSTLVNYRFVEHPVTLEMASVGMDLMRKFSGISFYDAGYHALGLLYGGTFLTADEKYYRKTRRAGRIMLLKDYGKKRR